MKVKTYQTETLGEIEDCLVDEIESGGRGEDLSELAALGLAFLDLVSRERPQTQEAVFMRLNGLTDREISGRLGVTQQSVNKRIARIEKEARKQRMTREQAKDFDERYYRGIMNLLKESGKSRYDNVEQLIEVYFESNQELINALGMAALKVFSYLLTDQAVRQRKKAEECALENAFTKDIV